MRLPVVEFDRPLGLSAALAYTRALNDAVRRFDAAGSQVVSARVHKGHLLVEGSDGVVLDMWVRPCDGCPLGKRLSCPHAPDADRGAQEGVPQPLTKPYIKRASGVSKGITAGRIEEDAGGTQIDEVLFMVPEKR